MIEKPASSRRLFFALPLLCATGMIALLFGGHRAAATPKETESAARRAAVDTAALTAQLGKALFSDKKLSSPAGMACATCHSASAGFTYPESSVNLRAGPVPGVVRDRAGFRRPPTIAYATYLPQGPPHYVQAMAAFVGGLFWDGHATDLADQATFPFQNPNEMNNLVHDMGDPSMVVSAVENGRNAALFKACYGPDIFQHPTDEVFGDICAAIAAFESTSAVSPFSSKYDAFLKGRARFNKHEMNGLMLFTGSTTGRPGGPAHKFAQCVLCHGIPSDPTTGPDLWTNSCFANIGVPKNPENPYYNETDATANPAGYNPAGNSYIDLGLGGVIYPEMGLPPGNLSGDSESQGDFLQINGTFKAPTMRNVDKRPEPGFVKCYGHNGFFKSLKQVVHFYNTRNLTTRGEVIDFTAADPYANLAGDPLWPAPEYPSPDTLQNPNGAPNSAAAQVGNLQLSDEEEDDIVAFLKTLSDGYIR